LATCYDCGGEIEFRYIDGVLRPIHLSGSSCEGSRNGEHPHQKGWVADSYLNPNARCPVCGEAVFFYQSRHGGRVFFDDVGWPWPKHECTDRGRPKIKTATVQTSRPRSLFDKSGTRLKVYYLDDIEDSVIDHVFVFRNQINGYRVKLRCSKAWLLKQRVRLADFLDAPSFLIHEFERGVTHIRIDFLSVRLERVVRMKLGVAH